MPARSTRLRDAALAAARAGLYVFPCVPHGKVPALHGATACTGTGACAGGHLGWEQRATRDEDQIAAWWDARPWNIGAAIGRSDLIVIDLDHGRGEPAPERFAGAAGGTEVLQMLAERAGQPAPWGTYTVTTPTGGLHLYFHAPAGRQLRNTAGETGLGWKIDTRAHGGFVVAAGSIRTEGRYRVINDQPIADLPPWLADALNRAHNTTQATDPATPPAGRPARLALSPRRASAYLRAVVQGETNAVTGAAPGGRNHALNRAAFNLGRLVGGGELSETEARQALLAAATAHIDGGGFTETEAHRTITSGLTAGRHRPRRLQNGDSD